MSARLPFRDSHIGPPIPAHDALPTLRLPRDRHLKPKSCAHCGGHTFDVDENRGSTVAARLVCLLCSRQSCWIVWER